MKTNENQRKLRKTMENSKVLLQGKDLQKYLPYTSQIPWICLLVDYLCLDPCYITGVQAEKNTEN